MRGRVFAVVGPSAAGKDTLLAGAVAVSPDLQWARWTITRPETASGEPFSRVSMAVFETLARDGAFALHWKAHGLCYGVPISEFAPLDAGRDVLFNGSRSTLPAALEMFSGLIVIRVTVPSMVLAERMMTRGRESMAEIEARLARASFELPEYLTVIDIANDATAGEGVARLLAALQVRG